MRTMTVEQFAEYVQASIAGCQQEHILVTRNGDPVAVLVGIEHKDEEDWRLQLSPEFWRMIDERRQGSTVPLEDVEAELFNGKDWTCRYSMVIRWSDEDQAFLVTLPEFDSTPKTHGATYEEAAKNGREVLELLIETYHAQGQPLPEPAKAGSSVTANG